MLMLRNGIAASNQVLKTVWSLWVLQIAAKPGIDSKSKLLTYGGISEIILLSLTLSSHISFKNQIFDVCICINFAEEQVQERMVHKVEAGSTSTQRVAAAVQSLPSYCEPPSNRCSEKYKFRYWTIRDYEHAYTSGRVTPTQVKFWKYNSHARFSYDVKHAIRANY